MRGAGGGDGSGDGVTSTGRQHAENDRHPGTTHISVVWCPVAVVHCRLELLTVELDGPDRITRLDGLRWSVG